MKFITLARLIFLVAGTTAAGSISFKEQCLKWHNYFRFKHQAAAVKWSEDLELEAQSWSSHLAGYDKFEHSRNFGENLFLFEGKSIKEPCTMATKAFYDEMKFYDFSKPGFSQITGHFTQVVWKATSYIGAAKADGRDGRVFVVVRYDPIGNINSEDSFRRNVLPENHQAPEQKNSAETRKSWPSLVLVMLVVAGMAFGVFY